MAVTKSKKIRKYPSKMHKSKKISKMSRKSKKISKMSRKSKKHIKGSGPGKELTWTWKSWTSTFPKTKPPVYLDPDEINERFTAIERDIRKKSDSNDPNDWVSAASKQVDLWYALVRDQSKLTVKDRGTEYYNVMDLGGIGEKYANVMSYKKLIEKEEIKPYVMKALKTKHAEPMVRGGIIRSTLEMSDPGPKGEKEDKEKYAFIMWWKNKNNLIGTSLDQTQKKESNGQERYMKNEIDHYILRNPIYFLRKGFDDEYDKFLELEDNSEEKNKVMDFYENNKPSKSSAPTQSVPKRLPGVFNFPENKKHDSSLEVSRAASNRMEQMMTRGVSSKPAPPPMTRGVSSQPAPPPMTRGAPSKPAEHWDVIDKDTVCIRLTSAGHVMISNKGATTEEAANARYVTNTPQEFITNLRDKEKFEWDKSNWELNKKTRLYFKIKK